MASASPISDSLILSAEEKMSYVELLQTLGIIPEQDTDLVDYDF